MAIEFTPVGYVQSSRKNVGDDNWDKESAYIELGAEFTDEALFGLSEFSHAEIIFYMDKVDRSKVEKKARHPRENTNWPRVGIFAQRGKNRPNQIGATVCQILKVEGRRLYLKGLDAIDNTPVLDIKPWVQEFAPREKVFQPKWMTELMSGYWE